MNDDPVGWNFVRGECEFTRRGASGQFSKFGAIRKSGRSTRTKADPMESREKPCRIRFSTDSASARQNRTRSGAGERPHYPHVTHRKCTHAFRQSRVFGTTGKTLLHTTHPTTRCKPKIRGDCYDYRSGLQNANRREEQQVKLGTRREKVLLLLRGMQRNIRRTT